MRTKALGLLIVYEMNKINQHMYVEFTFDVEVEDGVKDGFVEDVVYVGGDEAWKNS